MSLAEFYGVGLDWLASGKGMMVAGQAAAQNEVEALALHALRSMPTEEAKALVNYLLSRVKPSGN